MRLQYPDPQLDALEHEWWNKYSDVVERVWANNPPTRLALRSDYLRRAANFLADSANTRPLLIELGCGSGWVGHAIASTRACQILGIDLSESQIELAKANAAKAGLADICTYKCMNLSEAKAEVAKAANYSGVLIHAILHHLSWQEIHGVLQTIQDLHPKTKLYVYEPLTYSVRYRSLLWFNPLAWLGIIFAALTIVLTRLVGKLTSGTRDRDYVETSNQMFKLASDNNWVLSPKEIVFTHEEMHSTLSKYFDVERSYLCNYADTIPAYLASLSKNDQPPFIFTAILIPLVRLADKVLVWTGALPIVCTYQPRSNLLRRVFPPFGFFAFECSNKAR